MTSTVTRSQPNWRVILEQCYRQLSPPSSATKLGSRAKDRFSEKQITCQYEQRTISWCDIVFLNRFISLYVVYNLVYSTNFYWLYSLNLDFQTLLLRTHCLAQFPVFPKDTVTSSYGILQKMHWLYIVGVNRSVSDGSTNYPELHHGLLQVCWECREVSPEDQVPRNPSMTDDVITVVEHLCVISFTSHLAYTAIRIFRNTVKKRRLLETMSATMYISLHPSKNYVSPCRPFEPHVCLFLAACKGAIQGPSGKTHFKKCDLQMDHVKP